MSNTDGVTDSALTSSVSAEQDILAGKKMAVLTMSPVDGQAFIRKSFLLPTDTVASTRTLNTLPFLLIPACVLLAVLMACGTMRSLKLASDKGMPAPKIFQTGYRFKMCGINTPWISAKMVDIKARGDRFLAMLVVKTMSIFTFQAFTSATAHVEYAISATESAYPFDATVGAFNCLGKEAVEFESGHRSIVP